jgi:hypothetical protein
MVLHTGLISGFWHVPAEIIIRFLIDQIVKGVGAAGEKEGGTAPYKKSLP